jgi:tRNA A37 threonylcarbamoyladenosine dehydratase
VQLSDSALVALEAGDRASHDKLTKRVRAVIAHRSTSNADVLVACVASDEQVTAPAQMRRHLPTLAVRCSSCCEGARCRRCACQRRVDYPPLSLCAVM